VDEKDGYPGEKGSVKVKFPWLWPTAASALFFLVTVSFLGYGLYGLSEMKGMMQRHGNALTQILSPRGKKITGNNDLPEALSIKLGNLENQVQKLYDLLQENGVRLNEIAMVQEQVLPVGMGDAGKLEDKLADAGVLEIKAAEAGEIDSGSLNVPPGDAGVLMRRGDRHSQPEVPTNQEDSSGHKVTLKQPSSCFKIYKATNTDTLWDIAQKLYGWGVYYPVLLEHNPGLRIYDISSRDTLRYLCDKRQAARIYKKITAMKNNRRYWKYTLRPGDTMATVTERYCSSSKGCFVEETFPEIGKTIGIFLE
jgi:hypothetical protein